MKLLWIKLLDETDYIQVQKLSLSLREWLNTFADSKEYYYLVTGGNIDVELTTLDAVIADLTAKRDALKEAKS